MSKLLKIITLVWILMAACLPASAAYKVTDLLAGRTRPDVPGESFALFYTPAIDGDDVVFTTSRGGTIDAIWRYRLDTGAITKLAGCRDEGPGLEGDVHLLLPAVRLRRRDPAPADGFVAFFAIDSAGVIGLYQIQLLDPRSITRIASTAVVSADGSRYTRFGGGVDFGPRTVYFYTETAAGHRGVHAVSRIDSSKRVLIDERTLLDARGASGPVPKYFSAYGRVTAKRRRDLFLRLRPLRSRVRAERHHPDGPFDPRRQSHEASWRVPRPHADRPVLCAERQRPGGLPRRRTRHRICRSLRAAAGRTATLVTSTRRNAPVLHKPFQVFTRVCAAPMPPPSRRSRMAGRGST